MSVGSNKFGHLFQWTSFGESHGTAMGVVIDGCPAGIAYDESLLLQKLAERRPGQHDEKGLAVSDRKEADFPKILSGVFENKTLGTPIAVVIENTNQRSVDYDKLRDEYRPGHADDVWQNKFGHRDHRGGGRASARETVNWVVAGAFAQMFCRTQVPKIHVQASLVKVGGLEIQSLQDDKLVRLLDAAKDSGESYGGVVELSISQVSSGLGEPIFKKMKSEMAHAFMTINACNGVEFGQGFALADQKGSEIHLSESSSVYGGIRGGISTGETISFRLSFKPTSSIGSVAKKGRHDPCVVVRALPIVEAMAWNVLADQLLMKRLNKI